MAKYTVHAFPRMEGSQLGQGITTEYRSEQGETLAYVDFNEDQTVAAVTIFNPYRGGRREYSSRPAAKAEAIATKHCQNY